ncbi:MAG: response regulator [Calditrichaeota bacterium]|nr:response regulator [Calditrichota bacterium]
MADNKKILIADDDIDMLEQLKMQLQGWGFEVIEAESQEEAERKLERLKPDLAIYDLMMENRDSGFVLSYKTKKKYPDVPVIIVTAVTGETGLKFDAGTEEMRRWIKAEAILDKDIRFEQLKREIDRLLGEDR